MGRDLEDPYRIGPRDPSWKKRKPEITLDLVLLAAVYGVTTREDAGSYVLGARAPDGTCIDVRDVAGVDRARDAVKQGEILREGITTGERIERPGASGVRPGIALRPHIVVTAKFEGIVRERLLACEHRPAS